MTLAEFLLARILEDEEAVWDLAQEDRPRWLARCDALRRAVYACPEDPAAYEGTDCEDGRMDHANDILRILATTYADHPDYRKKWKP